MRLSYLLNDADRMQPDSIQAISYKGYLTKALRADKKGFPIRLRVGKGPGNEALLYFDRLPIEWRDALIMKFGRPEDTTKNNQLEKYFSISLEDKSKLNATRFDDGTYPTDVQVQQWAINAAVIRAILALKAQLETNRRKSGNGIGKVADLGSVWDIIRTELKAFNTILKNKYGITHNMAESERHLKKRLKDYERKGIDSVIDGRARNKAAQIVTPQMLQLWKNIYAGQKGFKPNYVDVYQTYCKFLEGKVSIVENETGELYDWKAPYFRIVSVRTVRNYQDDWKNAVATKVIRQGDRQKMLNNYKPYHKLKSPDFAGTMISIDDRQPPFEYETGKRMWFYLGLDVGADAFTTCVFGESKEGIIMEFYRQMVRNYHFWNLNLPRELEGEMALKASYLNTFLQEGVMFERVRIEANNARGKIIETRFNYIRNTLEKKLEGWKPRPFAIREDRQAGNDKQPFLTKEVIIQQSFEVLEEFNNMPHPNQELHPGMTRWDVFLEKQDPEGKPINWNSILKHIGYKQNTSMRVGRITLQGMHRVVGRDGQVALGNDLIDIMKQIEGKDVQVYWLDKEYGGEVMKALVYDMQGRVICELLDDLGYNRSSLERTDVDNERREITSAYKASVMSFLKSKGRDIKKVSIIELEQEEAPISGEIFTIPGIGKYQPANDAPPKKIEMPEFDNYDDWISEITIPQRSTLDRFTK